MPGRKLSRREDALANYWDNPPVDFPRPLLRQIRIDGGPGLRGIRRLVVTIPYPLTAICGRNGAGKTTLLSVAALSAKPPDEWRVYWGNTRPRVAPNARVSYAFSDFFPRARGDPSLDGLRMTWVSMDHGNEVEITRVHRSHRWVPQINVGRAMRGPVLLRREIDFIPMSRVLAGGEVGTVRNAFQTGGIAAGNHFSHATLQALSYVMGKQYDSAETRVRRGLSLPFARSGSAYSGFDMGGGETSVIVMLSRLEAMPVGGLVLIEELELGLHAEAQARLVDVLIRYCHERRVQVIFTTHSEVVLDRLPRRARVLLRASAAEHEAMTSVSTRFAVHDMIGEIRPELLIYTEDRLSGLIAEHAIPSAIRSRCDVRDIGSNVTLARQAVSHLRSGSAALALSVFDGDCQAHDVEGWIGGERAERTDLEPAYVILPADGLAPERWLLRELATDEYLALFAGQLNCDEATARRHVAAMQVALDHHDCCTTLARRTGLDVREAERAIVASVARTHPALTPLREKVAEMLADSHRT